MKLSERLRKVAEMVPVCDVVADIGTDHGYVPIYLVKNGRCSQAIAMDVNEGPLERAQAHIQAEGLEQQIETRRSDGLEALNPGEVNTVVIAGLGGELMLRIMEQGRRVLDTVETCILSPHSEWKLVRVYLLEHGYIIEQEQMVADDGKYYIILKVRHGKEKDAYSDAEYLYGRYLLQEKNPTLINFLKKEFKKYQEILSGMENCHTPSVEIRRMEILQSLEQIEMIWKGFGIYG